MTISNKLNHAESTCINLKALIGPTIPIKPNPADSFVPEIPIIPEAIPDIAAVKKNRNHNDRVFNHIWHHHFHPTENIDKGIPT